MRVPDVKRCLHWGGSAIAVIGVVFVAIRLRQYWHSQNLSAITPGDWIYACGLALFYGLAGIMLALAWRQLLAHFGVDVTRAWSIKTYGVSQLAKYVPGNVFHIAGRQALGMSAGISAAALVKSSLWELVLIVLAGILYGCQALPLYAPGIATWISSGFFLLTVLTMIYTLRRFIGVHASACLVWQLLFLAASGATFVLLMRILSPGEGGEPQSWLLIGSAYIVAWLAGLLTPGAPAGVGVRELILLFLLKNHVSEIDLVLIILVGRIVTVAGDVLFFCLAMLIPDKKRETHHVN